MPRSTSDSFRDNEYACATFATPFGISFFGWAGDEYCKLSMEELWPQYEAWERHQAALREQDLTREVDEKRVEKELFAEVEDDVQDTSYLIVEDHVPEIAHDIKPLTVRKVDTRSFSGKGPSKSIVVVQNVEADSACIHDKLDVGEAIVTEEEVSEEVVLKVSDATDMPPVKTPTVFIGADLLKRIFGHRSASGRTNEIIAAEELEDERQVEEWLFVGVEEEGDSDDDYVDRKHERRQTRVDLSRKRARRSLASIGNMMMR